MRMRWKPIRGEKFPTVHGEIVQVLETKSDFVNVIFSNGNLGMIAKNELVLPIIDTKAYERL